MCHVTHSFGLGATTEVMFRLTDTIFIVLKYEWTVILWYWCMGHFILQENADSTRATSKLTFRCSILLSSTQPGRSQRAMGYAQHSLTQ